MAADVLKRKTRILKTNSPRGMYTRDYPDSYGRVLVCSRCCRPCSFVGSITTATKAKTSLIDLNSHCFKLHHSILTRSNVAVFFWSCKRSKRLYPRSEKRLEIEVVVGANLNLFFFCRSRRTVVVVVVAYKLPFHSRPQSSSQLRYPASRGFSLAWLLAFTKWFASLVFVLYAPGSTSVTQTQVLENKAQCASR